jgi:hypothetical protein
VLFDVSTLYFETDAGDGFREPGFSKERRLEPQITLGLLTDASAFPLTVEAFEGNRAAQFVIDAYHQLWRIEKSFRMSKHDLQARPIYHHIRESIEAHLSIVVAAMAVSCRRTCKTAHRRTRKCPFAANKNCPSADTKVPAGGHESAQTCLMPSGASAAGPPLLWFRSPSLPELQSFARVCAALRHGDESADQPRASMAATSEYGGACNLPNQRPRESTSSSEHTPDQLHIFTQYRTRSSRWAQIGVFPAAVASAKSLVILSACWR